MDSMVLPSLKRGTLGKQVFEILHSKILSGEFKDGECLPPQEVLCERLGVSRTVIREALNQLRVFGFVDIRQGSGSYVRASRAGNVMSPTLEVLMGNKESMQELTETRYYLEQTIARLAARRADEDTLKKLLGCVATMEECMRTGDTDGYAKYDLEFHMALADASHNSVLAQILQVVRHSMLRFMKDFTQIPGAPETAHAHHTAIVDAVSRHDAHGAEQSMKEHIRFVVDILRERYAYEIDI